MIDILLLIGAFFVFVAAIGVHRLDDVFSRLHAATKAGTLGLVSVLLASMLFFWGAGELNTKQGLTIIFLFLTAPVSAHLLATAAYRIGNPKWDRTIADEAKGLLPRTEGEEWPSLSEHLGGEAGQTEVNAKS